MGRGHDKTEFDFSDLQRSAPGGQFESAEEAIAKLRVVLERLIESPDAAETERVLARKLADLQQYPDELVELRRELLARYGAGLLVGEKVASDEGYELQGLFSRSLVGALAEPAMTPLIVTRTTKFSSTHEFHLRETDRSDKALCGLSASGWSARSLRGSFTEIGGCPNCRRVLEDEREALPAAVVTAAEERFGEISSREESKRAQERITDVLDETLLEMDLETAAPGRLGEIMTNEAMIASYEETADLVYERFDVMSPDERYEVMLSGVTPIPGERSLQENIEAHYGKPGSINHHWPSKQSFQGYFVRAASKTELGQVPLNERHEVTALQTIMSAHYAGSLYPGALPDAASTDHVTDVWQKHYSSHRNR